jgi:geranylgeranyl pyrophosphate synthase
MTLSDSDGVANTINCANYVYFLALEMCIRLGDTRAVSIFTTEVLNLHDGQGLDILWREQCRCPTGMIVSFDYMEMNVTYALCWVRGGVQRHGQQEDGGTVPYGF